VVMGSDRMADASDGMILIATFSKLECEGGGPALSDRRDPRCT